MRNHATPSVLLLLAACALIGCENADTEKGVSWNGSSRPAAPAATAPATPTAPKQPSSSSSASSSATSGNTGASGADAVGDSVPFSALRWSFGGVNGSGASPSGAVIAGLSCSKTGLSFRYRTDLSVWGRGYTQAGDYACFFVQKSDGTWVGGKFDWISSSRTTRGFENIFGHYNGWSLAGVPNPCKVAFLVLNHDCKRRSNVISGTWSR